MERIISNRCNAFPIHFAAELPDKIITAQTQHSHFRMKASPGRGKLSPQVTDEGADKQG